MLPIHQGRAARKIISSVLGGWKVVPNNPHFDATRANVEASKATAVDLVNRRGPRPQAVHKFKSTWTSRPKCRPPSTSGWPFTAAPTPKSQIDYVIKVCEHVARNEGEIKGYRVVEEPRRGATSQPPSSPGPTNARIPDSMAIAFSNQWLEVIVTVEMQSGRIALDKIYKRRDRYEIPDWQRDEVWGPDKQKTLIDSVLRGWKLPKFYFQKTGTSPDTFDVVDGQQRLAAIWGFLDGDIDLSEATAQEFGAGRYQQLPDAHSDAFDDYEIEYDVIVVATDEEVKEFFQRLQAGLPLTSSEKLNSIHSKFRDYCSKLSQHPFFSESTTVANRRHGYFDICSKVSTLEIEGLDSGLRFDDVSEVFKSNAGFSGSSAIAKRVKSSLDVLLEIFPLKSAALRQRSMIQSVITLTCHLKRAGMTDTQAKVLKSFVEGFSAELQRQVELGPAATDLDYIAFQRTVNANIKSGPKQRHEILLRKLFAGHPDFFSAMSKSNELEASLSSDIKQHSFEIVNLIRSINEKYAARHGCDLFKATNKTVGALTSLGRTMKSVEDYQSWIDGLYFVFRESIGQRLDGSLPGSFVDVNSLRTNWQHDVDHGKGVATKRKKLASDFSKYAGVSTPDALAPEQFPLMQANLLGALLADLRALSKTLS